MDNFIESTLMTLYDFFIVNGIVILLACFVIGILIKGIIEKIPNKYIPIITTLTGVILSLVLQSFSEDDFLTQILKGAILGWAATGLYELLCLVLKRRFSIDLKKKKVVRHIFDDDPTAVDNDLSIDMDINLSQNEETDLDMNAIANSGYEDEEEVTLDDE